MEKGVEWDRHTCEVEVVIFAHVPDVEGPPDILGMGILLFRDVLVVELGEHRLGR